MYLYGLSLSNLIRIIHRLYIILLQLYNALALLNAWKLRLSIHWEHYNQSTCNSRACNTIEEALLNQRFCRFGLCVWKNISQLYGWYFVKGLIKHNRASKSVWIKYLRVSSSLMRCFEFESCFEHTLTKNFLRNFFIINCRN